MENKKIYLASSAIILIGLSFFFVVSPAFAFSANSADRSAAECGKNQENFSFASFLNPVASLVEKVVKDFGYQVSLAAAPDPDTCGSDSVSCSGATPTATISWTAAPSSYITYIQVFNISIQTGSYPLSYYILTISPAISGSPFNTGGATSYTVSSGLANNTPYNWSVDAYYAPAGYSASLGITNRPSGSFTTPNCAPPTVSHINLSPTSFSFSGVSGGATPAGKNLNISNTGNAALNWTGSTNQDWCHLGSGSGSVAAGGNSNVTVSVDAPSNVGSFNCTITISGANADNTPQTATVTYVVIPPPTVDLTSWPTFELPEQIHLRWTSTNADSCVASGDWSGNKPTQGDEYLSKPRGAYTFTLTCTGPGGGPGDSASDSVTVKVIQVPQCTFTANPFSIIPPASSTLSWSCQYADSCSIDQGIGSVNNVSGTKGVRPVKTTTYTLTCSGLDDSRSYQSTVNIGFIPKLREVIPR